MKITIGGSVWSSEQYTKEDGSYNFSYNDIWYIGDGKLRLTLYAEGEAIKVYSSDNSTIVLEKTFDGGSGNYYLSSTFDPKNDEPSQRIMILEEGNAFAEQAKSVNNGEYLSMVAIMYFPETIGTTYYSIGKDAIYLLKGEDDKPTLPGYPAIYASWDVIGHEYGHHVQYSLGLCSAVQIKDETFEHGFAINAIDKLTNDGRNEVTKQNKEDGLKLTWDESFATYWSTMAQTHFSEDYKSIATVGDTRYTAYNNIDFDINQYDRSQIQGDADEATINGVLYKVASLETDEFDKFSLGEDEVWRILTTYKPKMFYQFVDALYKEGVNKSDLGRMLAQYNVIGGYIHIENNYLEKCPTFKWETQSGSDALRMNDFTLHFYDSNGELIFNRNCNCKSESDPYHCSLTLSEDEWNSIFLAPGDFYQVCFVARQATFFTTGNYYSEFFKFSKDIGFSSSKIQIKPNEWGFVGRYYFQNELDKDESLRYSTLQKGDLRISTDRLRCGYIENSYVNLSPRREDAGSAYLEMTFDKPVYSFLYSICLWSDGEGLDGTAFIRYKNKEGEWAVADDLLNDNPLTTRKDGIRRYAVSASLGMYGIRFESTSTATGNRNLGRLCIDDIVLCQSSNLSDSKFVVTNYPKTNP